MSSESRVTLCVALAQGGITHYGYSLAEALQKRSVRTRVLLYSSPEYDLEGYPHAHRVSRSLELATSKRSQFTSPIKNLATLVASGRADGLVHFQWSLGPRNDRLTWSVLKRLGVRIIYTAHDVLPHEPEIMRRDHARWIYQHADALIVHGDRLKATMVEHFAINPSKVTVVRIGNSNFIADSPSPWNRETARASFGWNEEDRVVLFFGLIREYKGIDVLIDACRIACDRGLRSGQRLRLLIAGRSFRNHWEEGGYPDRIARNHLADATRTHIEHIAMPDIARFFHAADVVAIPYKRGSQSAVLQLAHSFAKPAVATRVGSLAESGPSELTRFVEPDDPAGLADGLHALLVDPDVANNLGARAREYVERELDWNDIARETQAVYASVSNR
jgi:D-inositol-3-phosphate glycosyltransferase